MILTHESYHSIEANREYMSVSQFKTFRDCEARGLAEVNGEWVRESTQALLVGSYIDAHFSGTLGLFKAQNPEIFTQKGDLRSEYKQAEAVIARIERDELFMKYISGDVVQAIRTFELAGIPWRIKIDALHHGKCIVDLKAMKDFEPIWDNESRMRVPFIEYWGYDIQGAVYQFGEGNKLPFIIAAATKEKHPDIALFGIPQDHLDMKLAEVIELAPRYDAIKRGKVEPERCGTCDYCRETKRLTDIVNYQEV